MRLGSEAEGIGDFLNRLGGIAEEVLDFLNDLIVDDGFRCFPAYAAADLSQIAAADIQPVGIELYIASVTIVLGKYIEEVVVEFMAPSFEVLGLEDESVDVVVALLGSFLHCESL